MNAINRTEQHLSTAIGAVFVLAAFYESKKEDWKSLLFLLRKNRSSPGYPISRLRVDIHEDSIDLYCKI